MNNTYGNTYRLLTRDEVFGKSGVLKTTPPIDIIQKMGVNCYTTDFCALLGGIGNYLEKDGWYYLSTIDKKTKKVDCVTTGKLIPWRAYNKLQGDGSSLLNVRPVFEPHPILMDKLMKNATRNSDGLLEVEFGEYPQLYIYDDAEIFKGKKNGTLNKTGKHYTVFFESKPVEYEEYELNGKKYIQVENRVDGLHLSDGHCFGGHAVGAHFIVEVQPIKWLIDEQKKILVSKHNLVAGPAFREYLGGWIGSSYHRDDGEYYGDFKSSEMYTFLNTHFAKDIIPSVIEKKEEIEESKPEIQETTQSKEESIKRKNPYDFNFDNASEEDIIRGAIESNVSVFLHGRSSEGKSARVKELDPDCEIIYMRNATPDSLNGKSVYNAETGEMIDIPPTWYTKVKEKCEAEPDKIHIIFFDELTNALPSIQGMAFNIVLDGEVNGKWKLPKNARIVAAGNDLNDSLAANQMAEPLFNRFAHVYIETTVDSWLKWASTPKEKYERLDYKEEEPKTKIHPSIYAYVAYKSYSGQDVLRTPYTGDKPNADPRKWEMASKVLYKTKQPEMLRSLVGEELTRDFVAFTKQKVITVEDVINGNYTERDLEMDISEKFATAVGLSSVDEEHFEIVREFMKKIGAEPRAAFESMWIHGDEKRLEYLQELQLIEKSQGGIKR